MPVISQAVVISTVDWNGLETLCEILGHNIVIMRPDARHGWRKLRYVQRGCVSSGIGLYVDTIAGKTRKERERKTYFETSLDKEGEYTVCEAGTRRR